VQRDLDIVGVLDHVRVGQDPSALGHDDARALAQRLAIALVAIARRERVGEERVEARRTDLDLVGGRDVDHAVDHALGHIGDRTIGQDRRSRMGRGGTCAKRSTRANQTDNGSRGCQ